MKTFFNYIKARINDRVPGIKAVRMWNNQFMHANGNGKNRGYKDEKAFKYPACFIEFIVNEVQSRALGIKDYDLTVRFRFGIEAYKFERLDTFDFCDDFSAAIERMAPTEESGLYFTTLQESSTEFDEDHDNVEAPYMDYRTRVRSLAAYALKDDITTGPITPVTIPIVTTSLEPNGSVYFYEPSENNPVYFREQIENSPVYFYE